MLIAVLAALAMTLQAADSRVLPIALVPIDDRPLTRQLPQLLGRIAGRPVVMPPRALLGRYVVPGNPTAVIRWLNHVADASAYVVSTDMLAYGGLIAARVPGIAYADAYARLQEIQHLRARHGRTWIGAFGTIMRLAPTSVPAIGSTAGFFAAGPTADFVTQYASLNDPPLPSERSRATHLRQLIGAATLRAYLATRRRDAKIDLAILQLTARGAIDRVVLGQDDAGAVGLHVKDIHTLQAAVVRLGIGDRSSIEPGSDELAMALVAHALARGINWTPKIAVRYSLPNGASFNDPLEYAPIELTIGSLIDVCGGARDDAAPEITLFVRTPGTTRDQDAAFLDAMRGDVAAGKSVAFADLTFLEKSSNHHARQALELLQAGIAGKIDAYASENTSANSVGMALAEAIAAGVGRRAHTYDARAHAEFTFDRYLDDYLYHDIVRARLNWTLEARGITDRSQLAPAQAASIQAIDAAELRKRAGALLRLLYPQYELAAMAVKLPWNRIFEVEIEARLRDRRLRH